MGKNWLTDAHRKALKAIVETHAPDGNGKIRTVCPADERSDPHKKNMEIKLSDGWCYCHRCKLQGFLEKKPGSDKQRDTKPSYILKNSQPADPSHPYLKEKQAEPHGARVYKNAPSDLYIPLFVPGSKTPKTGQFIGVGGKKKLLRGCSKKGAAFLFGNPDDDDAVLVCEGFATGASLYEATGRPVYAAIDASNIKPVVENIQKAYPKHKIVIACDNDRDKAANSKNYDVGWIKGCEAARAVGGLVCTPETPGQDFNDLHRESGAEAVQRIIDAAETPPDNLPSDSDNAGAGETDNRPEVILDHRMHNAVDAVENILKAARVKLYSQGGQFLVRPILTTGGAASGGGRLPAGIIIFTPVTIPFLQDLLNRNIKFLKYDKRAGDYLPTDAPKKIAEMLLARAGMWPFPEVIGVAHAPFMRPDGSIVNKDGYDPKTGVYVHLNAEFPAIPKNPSKSDAANALVILLEAVNTYPFDGPISSSVAINSIFAAIQGPALVKKPMTLVSSVTAGTGKSQFVDGVAISATGRPAAVSPGDGKPEEVQASLEARLIEQAGLLSLDNVVRPLGSSFLCQVLTQEQISIRIKGFSKTVLVSPRCQVFCTGNNLSVTGDLGRRTIQIMLDAQCERPERRKFKESFTDTMTRERGEIIKAVLTILRAWYLAGMPDQGLPPTGSYEQWSKWTREPLVWLGMADPWESQEACRADDPMLENLRGLFQIWFETVGDEPLTAKQLIQRAINSKDMGSDDLYDLLDGICGDKAGLNTRKLGNFLRRYKGRILDDLQLLTAGEDHRAVKWQMVTASKPSESEPKPAAYPEPPMSPAPIDLYDGQDSVDV